jgi:hypothetical protein
VDNPHRQAQLGCHTVQVAGVSPRVSCTRQQGKDYRQRH